MSVLATAAGRLSLARRLLSARVQPLTLVPVLVAIVLFKLAISDGGRDRASLTLGQTTIYTMLAMLLLAGLARRAPGSRALLGIAGAIVITSVVSVRPEASVQQFLLWMMYLGITLIITSALGSTTAARRFLDALVVLAGWLVLIALFMSWGANDPGMRWYSTFYWPNPFAAFLLLVLPLELVRCLHARGVREGLAHGFLVLVLAVAFVLTYSRGAWLSAAVLLPMMLIILRPPSWRAAAWRALFLAATIAAAVLLMTRGAAPGSGAEGVVDRASSVADLADYSIQGRLHFWRAGLEIFRAHPLLGTGAGTFGAVHAAYQRDARYYAKDAHNLYVQTAAEMGVIGLVALAGVLLSLARLWIRSLRLARRRDEYPLVAGTGLGLAGFFLHSAVDMDWMFPANPALAFALVGVLVWFHSMLTAQNLQGGSRSIFGSSESAHARRRRRWARWGRRAGVFGLVILIAVTQAVGFAQRRYLQAQVLARAGQWESAAAQYAIASHWNPLSPAYYAAWASALTRAVPPQYDRAEGLLRRGAALDRLNASFPFELARLLLQSGKAVREPEAETLLQEAIHLDRFNRPEAYRALARLYVHQGRAVEADHIYQEATGLYVGRNLGQASSIYLLLWPEVVGLFLDAAEASLSRGNLQRAAGFLEELLREDPLAVSAAIRLSEIYVTMGRTTEARFVLTRVAERVPENADVRAALERLP